MASERIAVIGGGNMGEALAGGMVSAGYVSKDRIVLAEPVEDRRNYLKSKGFETVAEGPQAVEGAGSVLFAVKPQDLASVLGQLSGNGRRRRAAPISGN